MKTFGKIFSSIAIVKTLMFGYEANAQDVTPLKISTETDFQQTSVRDGIKLQRTVVNAGDVTIKHDAKSNLNKSVSKDDLSDVGGVYIDNVVNSSHFNVGGSVTNLGNNFLASDNKNAVILDGWVNLEYDQWKARFEKGHSLTTPLEFDIANVAYNSEDFKGKAEIYLISNNGSMYNGKDKQKYAYILLGYKDLSASYAECDGVSHVVSTANINDKVGSFIWAYFDKSKRNWAVRSRMAVGSKAGDIDRNYFGYGMNEIALDGVITPVLYDMHLSPGIIRGPASLTTTIIANGGNTSIELLPGAKLGSFEPVKGITIDCAVGLGTYTEMNSKTSSTGSSAAVFSNVGIGKRFNASIDAGLKSITTPKGHRDDACVYLKTSYKF